MNPISRVWYFWWDVVRYTTCIEFDIHGSIHSSPVPAAPPQNVSGFNISKHEIRVFWEEVPSRDVNGMLLGYRVIFNETSDDVFSESVEFPRMNVTLGFLRPYTFYSLQVLAYTIKGDGPKSTPIIIRTEEEGKTDKGGDEINFWKYQYFTFCELFTRSVGTEFLIY